MTPDVTIRDYYLKFIYNAKFDLSKYNKELTLVKKLKESVFEYLVEHQNKIKENYNIDINELNNSYNDVINRYTKIKSNDENIINKSLFLQVIKYCKLCLEEIKYDKLINLVNQRKDLKFRQFQNYVYKYYTQVHKCILEGMGYKYGYGIGVYCCNYWKTHTSNKLVLDFAATRKKKKELINNGIKIYDENEAAWYKARKIPYDGVDYRVYVNKSHYYEFTFIKSRISKTVPYNYNRTEYTNKKYKPMSQQDIGDVYCKTIDDIYCLQVDIKCKLNILLYKYPNKYLNFIRNADQSKYKRRAYNSENR